MYFNETYHSDSLTHPRPVWGRGAPQSIITTSTPHVGPGHPSINHYHIHAPCGAGAPLNQSLPHPRPVWGRGAPQSIITTSTPRVGPRPVWGQGTPQSIITTSTPRVGPGHPSINHYHIHAPCGATPRVGPAGAPLNQSLPHPRPVWGHAPCGATPRVGPGHPSVNHYHIHMMLITFQGHVFEDQGRRQCFIFFQKCTFLMYAYCGMVHRRRTSSFVVESVTH